MFWALLTRPFTHQRVTPSVPAGSDSRLFWGTNMRFAGHGRRATSFTAVVLVLFLGTACSDDKGTDKVAAAQFTDQLTQTTTAFRARTTEIKADGKKALETSDPQKVLAIYESLRDATKDGASRYQRLTPPAKLASSYDSFLKSMDGQVAALDDVVSAAKKRDGKGVAEGLRRYASLLAQWASDLTRLNAPTGTKNS